MVEDKRFWAGYNSQSPLTSVRYDKDTRAAGAVMKAKFDIECTPEEARTFFGLPDVQPMQEALMKDLETRMRANIQALDPETMVKTWLPVGMQGVEQMQKMFWSQVQQTLAGVANATGNMANLSERKTKNDS